MKKFLLTLAVAVTAVTMWAVPAKPRLYTFSQSDGSNINVTLVGDEWHSSFITTDGHTVARDSKGDFYYRDINGLTDVKAHNPADRQAAETQYLTAHTGQLTLSALVSDAGQTRNGNAAPMKSRPRKVTQAVKPTGTKYIPVVLVSYSDVSFKDSDPVATFTSFFNSGSVNVEQYFKDQSENQFTPSFEILGHVQLTNSRAYYGAHSSTYGNDSRVGTMVAEACQGISGVNWSRFDNDNDGYVDAVIVIYAGVGEASSGVEDSVWPCRWQIYGSDYGYKYVTVSAGTGTKKVNAFGVFNELNGSNTNKIDGIGTVCHEFSHVLGLPDYYDVNYSGNFGMGDWSLMDGGCYNNDGYTPCAYGQYEKMFMGWKELETAVPGTTYRLDATTLSTGKGIKVPSPNNSNEYYILENIQKTGWNAYAHNNGLLVTHVYYNSSAWNNNTVNTTSTRRMTVIPADNSLKMLYSSSGYYYADGSDQKGDLYPYSGNNELTNESSPAATLYYSPYYMSKPITKITKNSDGTVSFVYVASAAEMGGPPTLTVSESEVTETSFVARWDEQSGAESYTLRVTPVETHTVDVMTETFAKCTQTVETVVNGSLTAYCDNDGWMAYRARQVEGGLRLGNSGTNGTVGYIYNRTFDTSTSGGKAIVTVNAYGIDADATNMKVSFADKADTVSITATDAAYTIVLNDITQAESQQLMVSGLDKGKRLVVTNVVVQYEEGERIFTGLTGSSYEVTGLTPDTYYNADMYTEYAAGPSDWGNRVVVHTVATQTAPDAPMALAATDVEYYSFTANWQVVDDALSYTLTVNAPDGTSIVRDGLTDTSYTLTDLLPGTQYTYYVVAVGEYGTSESSNTITVTTVAEPQYILGDANLDGEVNVIDVVSTALYTLERTTGTFWFKAADVNGDGSIDVTDIVGIVNISLGLDANAAAAPLLVIPAGNAALDIAAFNLKAGESRDIAVLLDNDGDYTAMQFDMTLPAGLTASNATVTERTASHSANVGNLANGNDRVILYSTDNDAITGSNGAVVMLTLTADDSFGGEGVITLDNIILADKQMHRYTLAPVTVMIGSETTAVDRLGADAVVITAKDGLLHVVSPVAQPVTVTTINGRSFVLKANAGHNTYLLPAATIYIVKVGDRAVKVRM